MNKTINRNFPESTKKGEAALSWAMVIVLGIALIGIAFPYIRQSVTQSNEPLSEEVGAVMDTSGEKPIVRHKITDLD